MTKTRNYRMLVLSGLLASLTACSGTSEPICNYEGTPPISVAVRDQVTGLPAAYSARLTLTFGTLSKTVDPVIPATDSLLVERIDGLVGEFLGQHGVYDVRVERPGYEPWLQNDVLVAAPAGRCGSIETVVLNAFLVRSSASLNASKSLQRR
jgi:hypothetical protein